MTLTEAVSRCWVEIDLDALESNFRSALSLLAPGCKLICVLKANAYGLGARYVSGFLASLGADFFAVADMAEAEEIRAVCPQAEILVLGLTCREEILRAIQKNIQLTCWSEESAALMSQCGKQAASPVRVQLKADTGLHRLGFDASSKEAFAALARNPHLKIEGLYTHLALHDAHSDDAQFAMLDAFETLLRDAGAPAHMVHACDSIGMVRYPGRHMDAVRTGAWLYGVTPGRCPFPEKCRPTVSFKARISDLHDLKAGERVGYDDDHPLLSDARVATLSAGYVDGFPRLNNQGCVLVNGRRAPVLGLVCMDQMMVDVTGIPGVERGGEVTLLGPDYWVDEYAAAAHLNRNESLCRIGRRVPRLYMRGGKPVRICLEMAE